MSVADILRKYGKWIQSTPFNELVAKELGISEKQAYRKIKKAWKNKEILKITLPNRNVLYGLPEFGASSNEEKPSKEDFLEYCVKKGWITKGFIEAYQDAYALTKISEVFKPLLEDFESQIEALKKLKEDLQ